MEVTHGISMVNSYGQKPMENSWIIPHDFSMGNFCDAIHTANFARIAVCIAIRDRYTQLAWLANPNPTNPNSNPNPKP